jgi:hypothetical protein
VSHRRYWAVARGAANKKGQRRTVDLYILVMGMDAGSNPIIPADVGWYVLLRDGAGLNMIRWLC